MGDAQRFAYLVKKQVSAACSTCDCDDRPGRTLQFLLHLVEDGMPCSVPNRIRETRRRRARRVDHVPREKDEPCGWLTSLLRLASGTKNLESHCRFLGHDTQLHE